ncbi:MAG: HD domain-containing phosphohydrolase [Clostridia bacterium]|jgi:diguanylate cyclase (GGDEF)-like protein/PAS domain S-box-containing protein
MNTNLFYALVNNTALLLVLSVIYEIGFMLPKKYLRFRPLVNGLMTSFICIAIMLIPFTLAPGLVFDTRSILISVIALTFGIVPTSITVGVAGIFRFASGGIGAMPGIAVIFASALIGLAWRRWLYPKSKKLRWLNTYAMSVTVHITMLACMLLLPYPNSINVIREISIPVLIIYPVASVILSLLIIRQIEHRHFQEQLKESQKALFESESKYRSYIENAPDAVFVVDETGRYLEVNNTAIELTGYSEEELLRMSINDITCKCAVEEALNSFNELLKTGSSNVVLPYVHKDGSNHWWTVNSVKISENRFLGFCSDVTDKKKAEDDLIYSLNHDYLTKLYNRKYFEESKLKMVKEKRLPISIIIADINGVRLINDAFGFDKGDKLIFETSKILQSITRKDDVLARIGGDEFGFILPETDYKETDKIVSSINKAFNAYNHKKKNKLYEINLSIGYATKTNEDKSIKEISKLADEHLHNQKLLNLKSFRSNLISTIIATVYEKSEETEQHSKRLSDLSVKIGKKLNLSQKDLSELELLSVLHDIGKVAIDDRILKKPDPLTEDEWIVMKTHPDIGYRIAKSTSELENIADYIRTHHERWDGKGYPQGLRGENIPLLSRILAVADAYDAMTNDRAYRKSIAKSNAIEELKSYAGTQFDPNIVKVFELLINPK